jgi:hypothetical protein
LKYFLLPLSLLSIAGCGVGSLYGPSYYDDTNLGEGLRRVTFKGGYHPATGELCLLRCAEVCLEEGYSFFEVVDSETGSSLEGHGSTYPFDQHYPSRDRFMDDVPFVAKTIRMLRQEPDANFVYNASEIKSSLRRKYKVK